MKLLVVAQREDLKNLVVYHLNPLGFEIVFYSDPVKVIDNLDEIAPEMVIFNAQDFPRHWKPVLKLLRERQTLNRLLSETQATVSYKAPIDS